MYVCFGFHVTRNLFWENILSKRISQTTNTLILLIKDMIFRKASFSRHRNGITEFHEGSDCSLLWLRLFCYKICIKDGFWLLNKKHPPAHPKTGMYNALCMSRYIAHLSTEGNHHHETTKTNTCCLKSRFRYGGNYCTSLTGNYVKLLVKGASNTCRSFLVSHYFILLIWDFIPEKPNFRCWHFMFCCYFSGLRKQGFICSM